MKLILKGFIIGLGKIMPGVSGAMIAITLNEYNKIIESIANIKDNIYDNIKYLSKIGMGIILAIIIGSKIIVNCLNYHYFSTMLLFIMIILIGTIRLIKEIEINKKDLTISIIIIIFALLLIKIINLQKHNTNTYNIIEFVKLIGIGMIDAVSSIVPGISGTALLMYFGYYDKIINTFATISDISYMHKNTLTLIPFIIGFILGTIGISKILNKLLKKYPNIIKTIVGLLMIYTLIILSTKTAKTISNISELIFGTIIFFAFLVISIKLSNKKKIKKYT